MARIRSLTRRSVRKEPTLLTLDDLTIEPEARTVLRRGKAVKLTPREFELLVYLVRERGRVVSREEILTKVWRASEEMGNVIDVHIRNLRKKLGESHEYIRTVHGVGYTVAA